MRAVEWVCRMVTPHPGRRARGWRRVVAATHPVSPPPVIPQPASDDETTFFPRINSRPYADRQETNR